MTKSIAILGASGYTGAELVRIIATHPGLRIAALSGDRKAGQAMAAVFPPGAAQASSTCLPDPSIILAGSEAARSWTHQLPSSKPARLVTAP